MRERVLCVGAVDGVAAVLLLQAEGFLTGQARVAVAAGRPQPGDGDALAEHGLRDSRAEGLNDPDAFVTGNERQGRGHRPVAVGSVNVGMADP